MYSSELPDLLEKFFLVKYRLSPNSWDKLYDFIDFDSMTLNLEKILHQFKEEKLFSNFFPEDVKLLSATEIHNLSEDFKKKENYLKGGYIQFFLEKFTDTEYLKAFLDAIKQNEGFFFNGFPYDEVKCTPFFYSLCGKTESSKSFQFSRNFLF